MIRLNVVVEGQTEEGFVKQVLYPYLLERNIVVTPRLVLLKRSRGSSARGGMRNYAQPKWDIQQWLRQDRSAYCTTMFDLYALPRGFPGVNNIPARSTPYQQVRHLEKAFSTDLSNPRGFIPYLQLHEFEAILFSNVNILDSALNAFTPESKLNELLQIMDKFENPELIDDDPKTAPSKRLYHLYPAYDKRFFGELVAEMIGMDSIRAECPHFNSWIERLEGLDPIT
ncbi:MAG: DUF4276 family protein [Rhodothermaceae bacterium]|nr:DUF4276 family protein [Rhodothermaceae bacterium]MYF64273.1 DUF4276 family protein [Rhodothermaceae bacterium]MYI83788.1 DUF4276 family protein [Rhodothermaceae bacterium]